MMMVNKKTNNNLAVALAVWNVQIEFPCSEFNFGVAHFKFGMAK